MPDDLESRINKSRYKIKGLMTDAVEDLEKENASLQSKVKELEGQAARYRWLRDNGYLDTWWSVEGPEGRCANIDADIDWAIAQQLRGCGDDTKT